MILELRFGWEWVERPSTLARRRWLNTRQHQLIRALAFITRPYPFCGLRENWFSVQSWDG